MQESIARGESETARKGGSVKPPVIGSPRFFRLLWQILKERT
jgi:hypothetical protein